jgi:hypothetical protein
MSVTADRADGDNRGWAVRIALLVAIVAGALAVNVGLSPAVGLIDLYPQAQH